MKFLLNNIEGKKGMAIKLMCLLLASVMFLSSCGSDGTSSKSKKKKKKVVVVKSDSSDVQDSSSESTGNDDVFEVVGPIQQEQEEDEGEDLKKDPVIDYSNRKSSVPAKYSKLVWNDEFNGDKLDDSIWGDYDTRLTAEKDRITSDDTKYMTVKNGELVFNYDRYFDPYNPDITYVQPPTLRTKRGMTFLYGYVEMCAKLPFNNVSWPALWTQSVVNADTYDEKEIAYMAEVDIFECFASKDTLAPSLHKWFTKTAQANGMPVHTEIGGQYKTTYTFEHSENLSNEYHVYGWEWTPEYMASYVDGVEYNRFGITDADDWDGYGGMAGFRQPMWLLIGSASISPETAPEFILDKIGEVKDEQYPFELKVDYIRIYQDPNNKESKLFLSK